MKQILTLAVALLLFASCKDNEAEQGSVIPVEFTQVVQTEYSFHSNKFANKLLFQLVSLPENANKNVTVSPTSLQYLLSMIANGCDEKAKGEILSALDLPSYPIKEINENNAELIRKSYEDPYCKMALGNSIWIDNSIFYIRAFVKTMKDYYKADIGNLDFIYHTDEAIDAINKWAEEKTTGFIPKVSLDISNETRMVVANAAYFNGKWSRPFNKDETTQSLFTNEDGSKSHVEMMQGNLSLLKHIDSHITAVELTYGKGYFSMILVMPNEGKSISSFNYGIDWWHLHETMEKEDNIRLRMPRFKIEDHWKELVKVCKAMGIQKVFMGDGVTKMASTNLSVSQMCQDLYIEVDEAGTTAAAISTANMKETSPGPVKEIVFNRPFIYAIRENTTGIILFMGKIGKL